MPVTGALHTLVTGIILSTNPGGGIGKNQLYKLSFTIATHIISLKIGLLQSDLHPSLLYNYDVTLCSVHACGAPIEG
jgi:hypothetical protein